MRLRRFGLLSLLLLPALASSAEARYHKVRVASFSTTSTSFVDVTGGKVTLTPSATTEIWILLFSARLKSSSTAGVAAEVQYTVNGVVHGMGGVENSASNLGGPWMHAYRITGTTAKQTIQVQIRDATGSTATIENLQVVAFRLPDNADFQYSETEGIQNVPGDVWNDVETLTFTPSSAGDYLILAVVNGHESPGLANIGIRLEDPAASVWPESPSGLPDDHMGIGRSPWQSFFLARVQSLAASSQTYKLSAYGSTGSSSEVRFTRLLAFRTDAFESVESAEALPRTSTTSTSPVVKASLTTAAPPASRDYIVIQSQIVDASGSATNERRAGFDADGASRASYGHVISDGGYRASFGSFDAFTSDRSVSYQNTFSTSNAAFTVRAKESVIHVLRLATTSCPCNALAASESGSTLTVTSPASFETIFDESFGASLSVFYDLAEDPGRAYNLAGNPANNFHGLFHTSLISGGALYASGTNTDGARLDLLEFTPTRVRVRGESFYQRVSLSTILPGIKGITDYSVYPSGRIGVGFRRKTTAIVPYTDHPLEMSARWEASPDPRADLTGSSETDDTFNNPATDSFVLAQREIVDARTDFLGILHQNWAEADQLEFVSSVAFFSWRDVTTTNIPANDDRLWNLLFVVKPTNFEHHLDPAVKGRRDDFRAPDALSFSLGSGWNENPADADFYNESEGAYTADFAPGLGLTFDMDGTSTIRYAPFFKIRRWRSLQDPSVTLEGTSLTNDVHFRADVKPVSRGHFAQDVLWSSTLQDAAAVTTPDVGTGGTVNGTTTFVSGRYGNGALFDAVNEFVTFSGASDLNVSQGAIELWYRPNSAHTDGTDRRLWTYREDASHHIRLIKTAGNALRFVITNGVVIPEVQVSSANFSWRANDWVHLRATWDDSAAPGDQVRIFVNGVEPAHTDLGGAYDSSTMVGGGIQWIGAAFDGTTPAFGVIDEFRIYGAAATPLELAAGGLSTNANEYLASGTRNATFAFAAVDAARRGEYLYLGADAKYRGLNISLQTKGVGSPDLQWQYWKGTFWEDLEAVNGFTDETDGLTRDGTIYWDDDPAGWSPYSVNGGPDLYYVRAHLVSGSYSTSPVEWMIKTDILLFQYCGDVVLAAQTFDFGLPATTAVQLVSFEARGIDEGVELAWETASEIDNLGFHLYRSESEAGPWEPLTAALVPGLGSSPEGAHYRYTDSGLVNDRTYFYQLEDVESSGKTTRHGPVSATPRASERSSGGASTPPRPGEVIDGNPSEPTLIQERGARELILELRTPGFSAVPESDGSVALSIPGFVLPEEPGSPAVPVKRLRLGVPSEGGMAIVSIRASDVVTFSGMKPSIVGPRVIEASTRGTVHLRRRRGVARASSFAGVHPPTHARVLETAYQGETKKALLELAPLQWDGGAGELVLARRLEVRLVFTGGGPRSEERRSRAHREGRAHAPRQEMLARLAVSSPGLQSVPFEELFPRGPAVEADRLRLSRLGEAVAFQLEPDPRVFGPGSKLLFSSEGPDLNPYGMEAVYELDQSGEGERMPLDSTPPSGERVELSWKRERREENRYYQAGLLEAGDRWLWDVLLAPATKSFPFEMRGLSASDRPARARIWLQGASDDPSLVDHHLRLHVNGVFAGETSWDGKKPHRWEADIASGVLRDGTNSLELENLGSGGTGLSMVFLDRFEVDYPSRAGIDSGKWEGAFSDSGWFELSGARDGILLDVTEKTPRRLTAARAGAASATFRVEAGHTYRFTSLDAVERPLRRAPATSRLRSAKNRADYLLIAPRDFAAEAEPLVNLRRGQGLRVMTVPIEEVFDEFGFGESRPEALREFLSYAYHHWREPSVRYVLLLGDGSYDYKDYLLTGTKNLVPPLLIRTSHLWTVSDPRLAAVNGEDELPDLAIGRLPAATAEEARRMVKKIVEYERRATDSGHPLILVADNPDRAGDFVAHAEELSRELLSGREVKKIYLSELGVAATRRGIRSGFEDGSALVSYLGHGGIHLWADENLLDVSQVSSLAPHTVQPLLLTMNCLNGYFIFPYFNSLAEELVKAEGKGAIAAFSPSGLSLNDPAHVYHRALLRELLSGSHLRLGDAVLATQSVYAESGASLEPLSLYHVIGDPALRIPRVR